MAHRMRRRRGIPPRKARVEKEGDGAGGGEGGRDSRGREGARGGRREVERGEERQAEGNERREGGKRAGGRGASGRPVGAFLHSGPEGARNGAAKENAQLRKKLELLAAQLSKEVDERGVLRVRYVWDIVSLGQTCWAGRRSTGSCGSAGSLRKHLQSSPPPIDVAFPSGCLQKL